MCKQAQRFTTPQVTREVNLRRLFQTRAVDDFRRVCVCVSVCVPSLFKCHKRSAAAAAQARAGAANHDMHTPPTHTHTKRECETQTTQRQRTLHLHTYRRDTDVSMPEASSIGDASPPPPPHLPRHLTTKDTLLSASFSE